MAQDESSRLSDLRVKREAIQINNIRRGFLRKLEEHGLGDLTNELHFLNTDDPLHRRYAEAVNAALWLTIDYDETLAFAIVSRWLSEHPQDVVIVIAAPCAALCRSTLLLEHPNLINMIIRHIGLCSVKAETGLYCGGQGTEQFIIKSWPELPSKYLVG